MSLTVDEYKKTLNVKPLSAEETKNQLNEKLKLLSKAYEPVEKAEAAAHRAIDQYNQQYLNDRSTLNRSDSIASQVQSITDKNRMNIWAYHVNPAKAAYGREYIESTREGVGLLMYTQTMRDAMKDQDPLHYRITQDQVNQAESEFKKHILDEQESANSSLMNQMRLAREQPGRGSIALSKFVRDNPYAAGQVLSEHPELVPTVCGITSNIQTVDRNAEIGRNVLTGVIIVGGVALAMIIPPAGIIGGELGMLGIDLTYCLATSATTTSFYANQKTQDLKTMTRGAITGNNQVSLKDLNNKEKQRDQEWTNFYEYAGATLLTMGAGQVVSHLKAAEKMRDLAEKMVASSGWLKFAQSSEMVALKKSNPETAEKLAELVATGKNMVTSGAATPQQTMSVLAPFLQKLGLASEEIAAFVEMNLVESMKENFKNKVTSANDE